MRQQPLLLDAHRPADVGGMPNARWPGAVLRALATVYVGPRQHGIALCFAIALLLFPTGRLPSHRRWRVLWLVTTEGCNSWGPGSFRAR